MQDNKLIIIWSIKSEVGTSYNIKIKIIQRKKQFWKVIIYTDIKYHVQSEIVVIMGC